MTDLGKKITANVLYLIIAFLLVVIVFERSCNRPGLETITETDTVVVYQTYRDTVVVTELKPVYIDRIQHDTIIQKEIQMQEVDTSAILADYFAVKFYDETYTFDFGEISIRDTVRENAIIHRAILPVVNVPEKIVTIYICERKRTLFMGANMTYFDRVGFAPSLGFMDKRKRLYTLSYDPMQRGGTFGMYWGF